MRVKMLLEEVVSIEERLRPRDHPLNAAAILLIATAYREVGDLQAARAAEERGIAILEATTTQGYQVAFDTIELATINDAMGEYSTALSVAERAVARAERVTSPTSTLTAAALGILATMHSRLGDHAAAVSIRERVVKDPGRNKLAILAADASRLAALLLPYIARLCAVVAPGPPGASTPRMANLFLPGS